MNNPPNIVSTTNWNVNSLRYSLFPKQNYVIDNDWWMKIVGTSPENISINQKISAHHYEGEFHAGLLVIDLNPIRIDINYIATKLNYPNQQGFLSLGLFDKVVSSFIPSIHSFLKLDNCPAAQRIAFGVTLFSRAESKESSYLFLSEYLKNKIVIDPKFSRDFLYQINRPKKSTTIDDLEINRLSKYFALKFQTIVTQPFSGLPPQNIIDGEYTANLEIDINTQGDYSLELSRDQQLHLLDELVNLARDISIQGDIE
jgi:hypothetical protein